VACGALAGHIRDIVARRDWPAAVTPLPAVLHNRPQKIVIEAERAVASALASGRSVALAYADCGSYGALDELCARLLCMALDASDPPDDLTVIALRLQYHPALACPLARTTELANYATRLERMEPDVQERLINWGYAVCDAALRTHVDKALPQPKGFPYPASGV